MTIPSTAPATASGRVPGAVPPTAHCNARTRGGRLCRNVAGFRTDHVGAGRCYLHGGRSPRKTGLRSIVPVQELSQLMRQHGQAPSVAQLEAELPLVQRIAADLGVWASETERRLVDWYTARRRGVVGPPPRLVVPTSTTLRELLAAVPALCQELAAAGESAAVSMDRG